MQYFAGVTKQANNKYQFIQNADATFWTLDVLRLWVKFLSVTVPKYL